MHGKGFKGSGFLFLEVKGREYEKGRGVELMEGVFHGWAIKTVPLVSLYLYTILLKDREKGGATQKLLTNVESFLSVTAMESIKIPRLQFCKNLGNS